MTVEQVANGLIRYLEDPAMTHSRLIPIAEQYVLAFRQNPQGQPEVVEVLDEFFDEFLTELRIRAAEDEGRGSQLEGDELLRRASESVDCLMDSIGEKPYFSGNELYGFLGISSVKEILEISSLKGGRYGKTISTFIAPDMECILATSADNRYAVYNPLGEKYLIRVKVPLPFLAARAYDLGLTAENEYGKYRDENRYIFAGMEYLVKMAVDTVFIPAFAFLNNGIELNRIRIIIDIDKVKRMNEYHLTFFPYLEKALDTPMKRQHFAAVWVIIHELCHAYTHLKYPLENHMFAAIEANPALTPSEGLGHFDNGAIKRKDIHVIHKISSDFLTARIQSKCDY